MTYNNFIYTVFKTDETSITERDSQGFTGGNFSTDGNLVVGDKCVDGNCTCTDVPTKPTYVVEAMSNWPHLSHQEALALVHYEATSDGASDGWFFSDLV
jgi:hypothetical protein